MKKLVAYIILFAAGAMFAQPKINFREDSLPEILKVANTENKPVMLMGYATWCSH